jgi:hypothetical protein
MPVSYPRPLTSRVLAHMDKIANAILEYKEVAGQLPAGSNADMVRALQSLNPRIFWKRAQCERRGHRPMGQPYVYLVPGSIFSELFDLYSVGPSGKGRTRPEERILCELKRM